MPLKINVPYSEKDLAKEKGAFWDKDIRHGLFPIIKTSIYFLNGLTQIRYQ